MSFVLSFITNTLWDWVKGYWYLPVIAVLSFILMGTCGKLQKSRQNLKVYDKNYRELQRAASEVTKQYEFTESNYERELERLSQESGEWRWAFDSLKEDNIKLKNINSTLLYRASRTDTFVDVKFKYITIDGLRYNEISKEGCGYLISGGFFEGDSTYDLNVYTETNVAFFGVWERNKLFNWKWTPKWGKKNYKTIIKDQCSDTVYVNESYEKLK